MCLQWKRRWVWHSTIHRRVVIVSECLYVYLCTSWWKTVFELELRWKRLPYLVALTSLTLIVKNWGVSGCSGTWKGSSESCSSEALVSVELVLKTIKLELEEIISQTPTIYQIRRKEFFFIWSEYVNWCQLLILKGNSYFSCVIPPTDLYLHPCREQEPMRKCWLKFLPPEHPRKCGRLNRFICKVKFSIK